MRHANGNWNLPDPITWNTVPVAVLMDIRDRLDATNDRLLTVAQQLSPLQCGNFLAIPRKLDRIARNTTPRTADADGRHRLAIRRRRALRRAA